MQIHYTAIGRKRSGCWRLRRRRRFSEAALFAEGCQPDAPVALFYERQML
jgi:hypothetical protein